MKKFDVEITETLQRTVTVEAASREEAERMVDRGWHDGDYVLTDADYVGVDFKTTDEHELSEKKMLDVLLVKPNEPPQNISIGAELKDLQEQTWDPVLNGALTPAMVTPGSHKKVWWRCPENHVWKAVVYSRTSDKRCGCPVCAGKVSQKNLGRYQVPLVPGGAEKAPE